MFVLHFRRQMIRSETKDMPLDAPKSQPKRLVYILQETMESKYKKMAQ